MASPQLDLAFAMDCTGSMGAYIDSAKEEHTFVTKVNDFTPSISRMKSWLERCTARGGGDEPEAVADAMHELLKLSWREGSAKLAVLVSDAPPHGIGSRSDTMPNGCPLGHDPMAIVHQLAEKDITLYVVGVEPRVLPYKDFYMVLAHAAGGRYVPLSSARVLAKAIIASAQEEMSLAVAMAQVQLEVEQTAASDAADAAVDEEVVTRKVHAKLMAGGVTTKQMVFEAGGTALPEATVKHAELSRCVDLGSVRNNFAKNFGPMESVSRDLHSDERRLKKKGRVSSHALVKSAASSSLAVLRRATPASLSPPSMPSTMSHDELYDEAAPPADSAFASSLVAGGCNETSYAVKVSAVTFGQTSRMVRKAMSKVKANSFTPK